MVKQYTSAKKSVPWSEFEKKQMKMTPQCNPTLHYTKQPLLSPNNQVTVVTPVSSKKLPKNERKKRRDKKKIKCVIVGDKQVGKTSLAVSYSNDSFPSEYVPTAYDNYNVDVQVDGKPIRLEICDTAGEVYHQCTHILHLNTTGSSLLHCYPRYCTLTNRWAIWVFVNKHNAGSLYEVRYRIKSPKDVIAFSTDNLGGPLRHLCYPGADVFMLCFSVVRPSSFKSAYERWADELTRCGAPVVLVGCQADLVKDYEVLSHLRRQRQTTVPLIQARELARRLNATYVETSAKTCNHLKEAFDEAIIAALKRRKDTQRKKWWTKLCCWKG